MIDKADFYHGAALVQIIEDARCESISRRDSVYLVNGAVSVCVKYTTKSHSPWHFTLTADDVRSCERAVAEGQRCVVALVCGGDGVCAVPWNLISQLSGSKGGWIASQRAFNACYSVSGLNGSLERKVARKQWPVIVFEGD